MSSLTDTAYYTRRTINWSILVVVGYILLRIFWGVLITLYIAIFPPKALPPNHAFGRLPRLNITTQAASPSSQLVFQLQTIEGSVPRASESATVYFMPKSASNLLALTAAQNFAKRLGFSTTPLPEANNKNVYRFDDPASNLRFLWYDIVSNNFILRYNFNQDAGLFLERNLPNAQGAQAEAKNILQTYNLYPQDFVKGSLKVAYYHIAEGRLQEVSSQSQADAIRVDFFRENIANTPVINTVPNQGPLSIIFSGSKNAKKRILDFTYTYWPIDYQTTATYPLKPSTQAWTELQSGGGVILRYPNAPVAIVRNVYLAYYDSLEPQTYLQPVFVFEGDDNFMALVPAIASDWVEQ